VIDVSPDELDHEPGGAPSGGPAEVPPPASSHATPAAATPAQPDHALAEVARARRRRAAKAVAALVVFVLLVLFIVGNAQPVEVNFLFGTFHPRLIWVMVTCAVLGGILGYLLGRPGHEAKPRKRKGDGGGPSR
jgi:uncharacterized integral membrane protein